MYERILVPVDGSPTSDRGLDEAIKLARLTNAKMRLVHVVDEYIYYGGMEGVGVLTGDLITQLRLAGKSILEQTRARAATAGLAVDTAMRETLTGRVADEVIEETKIWNADLLVIGTHGRRGVRRVFLGSDAEQIMRLAPVPVLLAGVQSKALYILFMTDDSLNKFRTARGWTVGADASVAVLGVGASAKVTSKTIQQSIIGYALTNNGLMVDLSLEGTKISRLDLA